MAEYQAAGGSTEGARTVASCQNLPGLPSGFDVNRSTYALACCAVLAAGLVASCGLSRVGEETVTADALGGGTADGGGDEIAVAYGGGDAGVPSFDDGGYYENDAGFLVSVAADAGTCDFNGTWASLLTINVSWAPMGFNVQAFILAPGSGQIKQWIKGVRVQKGSTLVDTTVVCGIDLPDFTGTSAVGGAAYGVVFPDSLFDDKYLPTFEVDGTLSGTGTGATYTTTAAAALLGVTTTSPTTDPWPATLEANMVTDPDHDGHPGVTIDVAQGIDPAKSTYYSDIPVGIPALFQPVISADKLYVAIRQVTSVTGMVTDCDHISGAVTIAQIGGQPAINSHVLGCQLDADAGGGQCTTSGSSSQASFVDNTQPVFTPSGTTTFQSARLPPDATCSTVRATLQ